MSQQNKNNKYNAVRNSLPVSAGWLIAALALLVFADLPSVFGTNYARASATDVLPAIHSMDFGLLGKMIDVQSFLNKPVKMPIPSDNPDGIPGGDFDYLYIYPPQFFWNKTQNKLISFPVKSVYFASGKTISAEKTKVVKEDAESYINYCFCNEDTLLDDLKAKIKNQSREPGKKPSYLEGIFRIFNLVHAEEIGQTDESLADGAVESSGAIQQLLDSGDPRVKQLLMLLLLNLFLTDQRNGTPVAQAANTEKEECLDSGGEWINGECVTDEETYDSGSDKETACSDSGGEWGPVSSSRALCLSHCGKTDTKCKGSALAAFEETEGIIDLGGDNLEGCKCPEGQCVDADGKCMDDGSQSDDDDNDGVPNGQDKCSPTKPQTNSVSSDYSDEAAYAKASSAEQVNMNPGSPYYGCSCSQLQAMGAITQQQCPPSQCEEGTPYFVEYPPSGQDQCVNGVVTKTNCSPISRQPRQDCAALAQQQQDQKNQDKKGGDQGKGQQDKGQQDKGQQGGQQGGGGCGQQPGSPGSPESPGTPEQKPEQKPPPGPAAQKAEGLGNTTPPEMGQEPKEDLQKAINEYRENSTQENYEKYQEELEKQYKVRSDTSGPNDKFDPNKLYEIGGDKQSSSETVQSGLQKALEENAKVRREEAAEARKEANKAVKEFDDAKINEEKVREKPGATLDDLAKAQEKARKAEEETLKKIKKAEEAEKTAEQAEETAKNPGLSESTQAGSDNPPGYGDQPILSEDSKGDPMPSQGPRRPDLGNTKEDQWSTFQEELEKNLNGDITLFTPTTTKGELEKIMEDNPEVKEIINSPEYQNLARQGWDINQDPLTPGEQYPYSQDELVNITPITSQEAGSYWDIPVTSSWDSQTPAASATEGNMPWQDLNDFSGYDPTSNTYVPSAGSSLPEIPQSTGSGLPATGGSGFSSAGDYIDSGGSTGLSEMYGGYTGSGPTFDPSSTNVGDYANQSIWEQIMQALEAGGDLMTGTEGGDGIDVESDTSGPTSEEAPF